MTIQEETLFIVSWNLYSYISTILFQTINSYVPDCCVYGFITAFTALILNNYTLQYSRYFIFEVLYSSVPYIDKRKIKENLPSIGIRTWIIFLVLLVTGTQVFKDKKFEYRILTVEDLMMCLLIFITTDGVFYISHSIMHVKPFYTIFHKLHHSIHKPTVWEQLEYFSVIDGLSHIAVYAIAYTTLSNYIHINNQIFFLSLSQWYIIGQMQHGGKAIEQNQLPGLRYIMKLFGIKSMCLQHDLHHTKFSYNFCMTGIYDRLFGTYYDKLDQNLKILEEKIEQTQNDYVPAKLSTPKVVDKNTLNKEVLELYNMNCTSSKNNTVCDLKYDFNYTMTPPDEIKKRMILVKGDNKLYIKPNARGIVRLTELEEILCLENSHIKKEVIENYRYHNFYNPIIYNKLVFNKYAYFLFYLSMNLGILHNLCINDYIFNIKSIILSYVVTQTMFLNGHMFTHYMMIKFPYKTLEGLMFVAFHHHYSNPLHLPQNWLYHRTSMLFLNGTMYLYAGFFLVYYFEIINFTQYYSTISWIWYFWGLQEPGHEWFHCPEENKKEYYPLHYTLFKICEKLYILDPKKHQKHHMHAVDKINTAVDWDDFQIPIFTNLAEYSWKYSMKHNIDPNIQAAVWNIMILGIYCLTCYI